jgi:hypothetical protein
MNKKYIKSAALGFLCSGLLYGMESSAQTWQVVGTAGFSASGSGVCNWQRLLIDQYNTPYLSFNDEGFGTNNGQGTIMKFNGTAWVPVGQPGFTGSFSHHSDFAFGHGDTLYYSFADGTSSAMSRAAVMRFDGTAWTSIGSLLTTGECQYSSIAVKANGTVYVGMIDNGVNNGTMVVKSYNGSAWTNVGAAPISTTSGAAYADMALDRFDTLYVAYQDMSESPGKVRVKKFDGTNWVNVGSPLLATTGPGAGPAMDIYLAFDVNNKPFVSYSHTFQGPPRISVEKFNGTTWELVGPAQFSSGTYETSLFSSLALPKSTPYIAYQHGGLGMKCVVRKYNSTTLTWEDVGTPTVSDDVSAYTSVALDGNGNVYVAYFDQANGGKNTVKKFTVCESPVVQTLTAENTPVCIDSATLRVTGTLNDATQWQWYSGSCNNGTLIGTGDSVKVKPGATTTYYVKGLGGCVSTGGCQSVQVDVALAKPTITLANNVFTSSATTGNQWYRNASIITGATGQTYTATQSGNYYTVVTSGNCSLNSDTLAYQPTSILTPGINTGIEVYPNPVKGQLQINIESTAWTAGTKWYYTITDPLGRTIQAASLSKQQTTADVSKLTAGFYFVRIANDKTSYSLKIVK